MIVTLNGFEINTPTNNVWLDDEIPGLDLPDIRTSKGNYSGRDGGYIGGQFFAARSFAFMGNVFSSDVASLEVSKKAFQAALAGGGVTVTMVTNAGNSYVIYAKLIDFDMPIKRNIFSAPFKVELEAPDPTIYDNTGGGALTATLSRVVSGGYTYPVTYPVTYGAGSGPTTVTNSGLVTVYPVITLTGTMTNPSLANQTTNQLFSISPITTGASDVVVIDMLQHTVTLNGGSIYALSNRGWWGLQPGGNSIALATSSGTDTVTGAITWRNGYIAI